MRKEPGEPGQEMFPIAIKTVIFSASEWQVVLAHTDKLRECLGANEIGLKDALMSTMVLLHAALQGQPIDKRQEAIEVAISLLVGAYATDDQIQQGLH